VALEAYLALAWVLDDGKGFEEDSLASDEVFQFSTLFVKEVAVKKLSEIRNILACGPAHKLHFIRNLRVPNKQNQSFQGLTFLTRCSLVLLLSY